MSDVHRITANLARNNIQESLRDLGPNTAYEAGRADHPTTIEAADQPNCSPLAEWASRSATGIDRGTVEGTWGSLSYVSGAMSEDILHPGGDADARRRWSTDREHDPRRHHVRADDAGPADARGEPLWIQGGTPTDPVLDQIFPGAYGFGALRCAIDNLNGDNVEWIILSRPAARHVFCYAYYVAPPPRSGTIIVRKRAARPTPTSRSSWAATSRTTQAARFSPPGDQRRAGEHHASCGPRPRPATSRRGR